MTEENNQVQRAESFVIALYNKAGKMVRGWEHPTFEECYRKPVALTAADFNLKAKQAVRLSCSIFHFMPNGDVYEIMTSVWEVSYNRREPGQVRIIIGREHHERKFYTKKGA